MKNGVKTYKRKFDRELKHVKVILTHERQRLPVDEWLELVKNSRESILSEPETFFGDDLPANPVLHEAIDKVFESFLEDQRLLANQTEKRFRIPLWVRTRY